MGVKRQSVGILGVQQGVGVTHLCTAMTHYCSEHLKVKTALVELSGHHEIEGIEEYHRSKCFRPVKAHYYVNTRCDDMPGIINSGYEQYIVDAGNDYYRVRQEFLRCNQKIIVASLSPWKRRELEDFMSDMYRRKELEEGVVFLSLYGKKKDKIEFHKRYHIPIFSYPYIEDPFYLKESEARFLRELL